jgi:hypothetical protein
LYVKFHSRPAGHDPATSRKKRGSNDVALTLGERTKKLFTFEEKKSPFLRERSALA